LPISLTTYLCECGWRGVSNDLKTWYEDDWEFCGCPECGNIEIEVVDPPEGYDYSPGDRDDFDSDYWPDTD
jgi:hypothetical protein